MIPLKDDITHRRFPLVNVSLIVINVAVFLYQSLLTGPQLHQFVRRWGVVPREHLEGTLFFFQEPLAALTAGGDLFLPLVTATFLHGSWLHLLGNMIYLWVFGDNIEDRAGSPGYLLLYLLMGAGGHLAHIISSPASDVPLIGASGAIAGVLGAYFILYPRARVLTLVPLGFFITFVYIPAFLFLALWFLLQLINAVAAGAGPGGAQAVAWWAHVGGFLLGVTAGVILSRSAVDN